MKKLFAYKISNYLPIQSDKRNFEPTYQSRQKRQALRPTPPVYRGVDHGFPVQFPWHVQEPTKRTCERKYTKRACEHKILVL